MSQPERRRKMLVGASQALRAAIVLYEEAEPDPREYDQQSARMISMALSTHHTRLRQLERLLAEIETLAQPRRGRPTSFC